MSRRGYTDKTEGSGSVVQRLGSILGIENKRRTWQQRYLTQWGLKYLSWNIWDMIYYSQQKQKQNKDLENMPKEMNISYLPVKDVHRERLETEKNISIGIYIK